MEDSHCIAKTRCISRSFSSDCDKDDSSRKRSSGSTDIDVPHLVAVVHGAQNVRTKVKVIVNGSGYKPSPSGALPEDGLVIAFPSLKTTNNFEGNITGHLITQLSESWKILIALPKQDVSHAPSHQIVTKMVIALAKEIARYLQVLYILKQR